jgi:hypothetical protein
LNCPWLSKEYNVEGYIKLLSSLVENKITDPRRIEKRCKVIRKQKKSGLTTWLRSLGNLFRYGGQMTTTERSILSLRKRSFVQRRPLPPDLHCVLGRAYLRVMPTKWKDAERSFRAAYGYDCQRPELFELWVEALEEGQDWRGGAEVAQTAIKDTARAKYYNSLGKAILEQANVFCPKQRYAIGN